MENPEITSRQNPLVKGVVRLRERKERKKTGEFVIDGLREARRGRASGVEFLRTFVSTDIYRDSSPDRSELREFIEHLRGAGELVTSFLLAVFERLAFGGRGEGIVVRAKSPRRQLVEADFPGERLLAVVEQVEKPGNLERFCGRPTAPVIDGVIVADGQTDLWNPNTIRASLGVVFRDNVRVSSSLETYKWLVDHRYQICAAVPEGANPIWDVDLTGRVAIILGQEASGLSSCGGVKRV